MTQSTRRSRAPAALVDHGAGTVSGTDRRRRLQLLLALLWLLDGALQFQPFMFTRAFSGTMAATSQGNPSAVAGPITWTARVVADQPVVTNAAFATIQVLIALGIAWRRTVKPALAASVVWAVAVWWFGEGFGGVLAGTASPVSGAPGAVILYALAAVLLWPDPIWRTDRPEPFVAARLLGARPARLLWLLLWAALAYFAVEPAANRSPQAAHDMITATAGTQPTWLRGVLGQAASVLDGHGTTVALALALVLTVIAIAVFAPVRAAKAVLVLGVAVATVIWVFGEAFGGILTGQGTDPNTGPLLALLAATYWPHPAQPFGRRERHRTGAPMDELRSFFAATTTDNTRRCPSTRPPRG